MSASTSELRQLVRVAPAELSDDEFICLVRHDYEIDDYIE